MKILWCLISTNMYLNTSGHLFYLYGQKSTGKMHSCFLSRKTIQKARAISSSRNYLPRVVGGSEVKVSYEILYAEFGSWKMWSHPELHATFQLVCDCNHGKKKKKQSVWIVHLMYSQKLTNPHVTMVLFFNLQQMKQRKEVSENHFMTESGFCVTLLPI